MGTARAAEADDGPDEVTPHASCAAMNALEPAHFLLFDLA
jgi:hypothetical protein